MKVGDYIQYRTAQGEIKGYALVVRNTGYWTIILDTDTGKEVYWREHLMRKIVK